MSCGPFGDFCFPVARKRHRCAWCGEWIEVGEKHSKYVGKFEGDFQSWRVHDECKNYYEHLTAIDDRLCDEGFRPGDHSRGFKRDELIARRLMGIERYWQPDKDQERC